MSARRRAELLLLAVTVIWGSTFVLTKSLLDNNSPLFYCGIRFICAALILLAAAPRRLGRGIPRSTWRRGAVLGLVLYAGFALQTVGLRFTTASKSAFFTGMMVVVTPLLHVALWRRLGLRERRLSLGNLAGVALGAFGLYLLTAPAGGPAFGIGDALTLLCGVLFAFYIVYLDSASGEPDKLQLTFVQFAVCGAAGLLVAVVAEDIRIAPTQGDLLSFAYLTLFATIVAMWVQNRFQGETTPTRAAVIFTIEPVVAAFFGYVVRGELLGPLGLAGAAAIIAGLSLSEFSEQIPLFRHTFGG